MKTGWLVGVLAAMAVAAGAQKATERFVPIGESPGRSGAYTVIGTVRSVDSDGGTITVGNGSDEWTATVTDETRIWLDRTAVRKSNLVGSFEDLQEGARVEVCYVDRESRGRGVAEWIKVESSSL